MKSRLTPMALLVTGLLQASIAQSAPPPDVQAEVNFLLDDIAGSGCEFLRNGAWHDSKAAEAHLRFKYDNLTARDLINSTDDFIELAASKSSLTGRPYEVRCRGAESITSNQWLHDELARFRKP